MRSIIFHILLLLLLSCSGSEKKAKLKQVSSLEEVPQGENFKIFLEDFSKIEEFQLSRIKFPLSDCDYPGDEDSNCIYWTKEDWKQVILIDTTHTPTTIRTIYDNFSLKMENSGERVVAFEATETNVCAYYYFKLQSEQWFLIKRVVCAD
ncbi:hypothetical protein OZ410_09265 [Robiginitalea sp. M366]|uniref:hypothetical protein n=1 Tax=Robiginitalea aestuariiviva TaxID=3036903 RepID=UPI00240CF064|nr:hypothetical protein [Robiginitalea aestuariiviva]MDG1572504.1 hypothetical protein [Robiginitalea aestuariiviva]